ncbi:tail fiber domain-containing protein [Citrobacter farmeri]|uniref:tail fiber domain-containing protein n=1 Tax=Citrobacter farmeri TaxID=67824 RepID=UPI001E4B45FB|nr:tail fiber domain-containing protein [Citrobacter farmeri]
MSAGTLTLTNNSALVSGAGTSFSTELTAGDFIVVTVGGVPYTLPIKAVNSNTSLTLVSIYTGPTQSGAAWSAVPRVALNMVTAALVAQSAEALRGLNYDKQNWQQVFSGTGTITVRLPDGTEYSGPAWNSLTSEVNSLTSEVNSVKTALEGKAAKGVNGDITRLTGLTTAIGINQGGTGATTQSGARQNLGLGSSATRNAYSTTGDMLSIGDYGLGSTTIVGGNASGNMIANEACGFYAGTLNTPTATSYSGIKVKINDNVGFSMAVRQNRAFIQSTESGASMGWREITMTAVSDITLKKDVVYVDGLASWNNVGAMQPVTFVYKDDMDKSPRRGFIAQDLEKIDQQYIKKMYGGVDEDGKLKEILTLDTNPLLMDALVVLKMLIDKDSERNRELELIRSDMENLKARVS